MDAKYVTDKAVSLIRQLHGTPIGATEFSGGWMPERVDAVLFNSHASFVIETKISRSDFRADFKKTFRSEESGLGKYRYYACPDGLIKPDELPEKWGLIYVYPGNKRAKMIVGYGGGIKIGEEKHPQYGWTVDVTEYHGTEPTKAGNDFICPSDTFAFSNRCMWTESKYLYALATRYKKNKFMENIL